MGLPWSAERLLGWRSQYSRVKRWHHRVREGIEKAQARYDGVRPENLDDVLAFFLFCYSLRDWVVRTGGTSAATIDALVSANKAMRICRDICHRAKHHTLSAPSVDADFSIGREYDIWTEGERWFVLAGNDRLHLVDLAHECMAFWDHLVGSGTLTEPPDPFGGIRSDPH